METGFSPQGSVVGHYLRDELYALVQNDSQIFDFLQQGSLDGIWYWDLLDPEQEWMSDAFWRLLGYDPAEMPHRADAWQDIIDPDDLQLALENFQKHSEDPSHPYDQMVRYRHKDGSTVTVRCRGIAIRDENGKPIRMLGAHTDLTELKRTEAALRIANADLERERDRANAASRAKSSFLATMSHEIRTPMNGVLGMANALSLTSLTESQKKMVSVVTRSGERLLDILNDVLDIAKIEAGEMSVEPVRFHADELCHEAIAIHRGQAAQKGVALSADVAAVAGLQFFGGAQRINQVIVNLVANAVKFTANGSVRVIAGLKASGNDALELSITVRDTGIGIDEAQKERIFEAFIQASSGIGTQYGGTGLGLAISRSICGILGGSLTVRDTPGGGATFVATFSVTAAAITNGAADAQAPDDPMAPLRSLPRPLRILVAEDNDINQLVLDALLKKTRVELVFVDNGQQALEAVAAQSFDAALIDIRMGGMSGVEVAREIRRLEAATKAPRLPLVAFTANIMSGQVDLYHAVGFDDTLAKPIQSDELARCITHIARQCGGEEQAGAA